MRIQEKMWEVTVKEHDRFFGEKSFGKAVFTTEEEADNYVKEINGKNTSSEVPDWYLTAEKREVG